MWEFVRRFCVWVVKQRKLGDEMLYMVLTDENKQRPYSSHVNGEIKDDCCWLYCW